MKAIIYGAGNSGEKAYRVFCDMYEIVAFVDRDKNKIGTEFEGLPVLACEEEIMKKYLVIMGTTYQDALEFCLSLNIPFIPYSCVEKIWWAFEKFDTPKYELLDKNLTGCEVLSNRRELLKRMPQNGVFAEIGVFRGDYSQKILEICNPQKLYLVDLWEGSIDGYDSEENYKYVKKRFENEIRSRQIEVIKSDSCNAMQMMKDKSIDFVYLDSCHNYVVPRNELKIAKTKVKDSGYICGHDYINRSYNVGNIYGVKEAVNEFCTLENYKFSYITMELEGHLSYALQKI